MGDVARDADPSAGVVDGGGDGLALAGEGDGLDEVEREDGLGLGGQEVGPGDGGSLWCWGDALCLEDLPDGGGGDPDAEEGEFAVEAAVSPCGVLGGEAEYQAADRGVGARAVGASLATGTGVAVSEQVAVPAQDGVRAGQ
ncbi:hypothetical protein [Streptomyces sp. NPDC059786]|uniref:hypothetical protein n=1 Tax=Streptomyces sp. NPDC059786 TaxID=3346946 RepID=UPI00364657D7